MVSLDHHDHRGLSPLNVNSNRGATTPSSPKKRLTVKLSKSSVARPLLYSKMHSEALLRIANLLENSEKVKTDVAHGKLPVEAAYVVMKRVTEATGTPILATGLSTFNKLNSLSTEPALKVLQKQPWREFFNKTDPKRLNTSSSKPSSRPHSAKLSSSQRTTSPLSLSKSAFPLASHKLDGGGEEDDAKESAAGEELREKSFQLLNELGEVMIKRIYALWKTLKIPRREHLFYEKSICSLPIRSLEQCQELSKLIFVLQQHEQQTRRVLQTILRRESAVEKCFDVIHALQRKFSAASLSSSGQSQSQMFWKEEFLLSLSEVRDRSMEVIRVIQEWRRSLWRPLSFLWRGVNYLLKMKEDFLPIFLPSTSATASSSVIGRLLEQLPLSYRDLQGIIFLNQDQSLRSSFATERPQQQYLDSLLDQFHSSFKAIDLLSAAMVVLEEESLQKAIQQEQLALTNKGVFIPILRPMTDSSETLSTRTPQRPRHTASASTMIDGSAPETGGRSRVAFESSNGAMEADHVVITADNGFSSLKRPPSASNQRNHQNRLSQNRSSSGGRDQAVPEEDSPPSPSHYQEDFLGH